MTIVHRTVTAVGVAAAVIVLGALTATPLWLLYVDHVFPMGRLNKSIPDGSSYESVVAAVQDYCSTHSDRSQLRCNWGRVPVAATPHWCESEQPSSFYVHVYDVQLLDDIQFVADFDDSGEMCRRDYWGD